MRLRIWARSCRERSKRRVAARSSTAPRPRPGSGAARSRSPPRCRGSAQRIDRRRDTSWPSIQVGRSWRGSVEGAVAVTVIASSLRSAPDRGCRGSRPRPGAARRKRRQRVADDDRHDLLVPAAVGAQGPGQHRQIVLGRRLAEGGTGVGRDREIADAVGGMAVDDRRLLPREDFLHAVERGRSPPAPARYPPPADGPRRRSRAPRDGRRRDR